MLDTHNSEQADSSTEYWNYLDRPETFIRLVGFGGFVNSLTVSYSIGDPEDALGRMLAVLRFWFTKDLV